MAFWGRRCAEASGSRARPCAQQRGFLPTIDVSHPCTPSLPLHPTRQHVFFDEGVVPYAMFRVAEDAGMQWPFATGPPATLTTTDVAMNHVSDFAWTPGPFSSTMGGSGEFTTTYLCAKSARSSSTVYIERRCELPPVRRLDGSKGGERGTGACDRRTDRCCKTFDTRDKKSSMHTATGSWINTSLHCRGPTRTLRTTCHTTRNLFPGHLEALVAEFSSDLTRAQKVNISAASLSWPGTPRPAGGNVHG